MNTTSATNISKKSGSGSSMNVPSNAEGIVWCSLFAMLSVLIVVGNLLTIVLFAVNKKLRKKSLFLVINMAFVDMMLGALALPLLIYNTLGVKLYQLWTGSINIPLFYFSDIVDIVSMVASLTSAAMISCDRFYAIYRPFKHRTLTVRTYRIASFTVWTVALLFAGLRFLLSREQFMYLWLPFSLTLTIAICGCNIAVWRTFQNGNFASQQQNRDAQNERLTKTLLFVSILALLCWLPVIVLISLDELFVLIPRRYLVIAGFLNCCNSFVNPIVYALRIPEFRQALALCCFRRREAVNTDKAAALTPAAQLITLQTDSNQLQQY